METLILIGLLSGLVTAVSPCVLPILPIVLVASTTGDGSSAASRRRPFVVIAGLVTSFTLLMLIGSALLSLLNLPQDLLRWTGIVILAIAGIGLLIPKVGEYIERPFARIPMRRLNRDGGAFTLGLGMGLVFVPCAGPVLAAITVLAATGSVDADLVALTVSFAIGVAIPLLIFAAAGQRIGERIKKFRTNAPTMRRVAGGVLLVMSVALATDITSALQRTVPGYVTAVQERLETSELADGALNDIRGGGNAGFDECARNPSVLADCGPAPDLADTSQTFNVSEPTALSPRSLSEQVVLVDFWTYSCINCQRTIPALQALHERYADAGLTVVGVHTPEFAFEKEPRNVRQAVADLGITYPVVMDNGYATWTAYANKYWPARYLVDFTGTVRQVHYGEGQHAETERLVRELLSAANPGRTLPPAIEQIDDQLTVGRMAETYLGYNRMVAPMGQAIVEGKRSEYRAPATIDRNRFALQGTWAVEPQYSEAISGASLRLRPYSKDVFIVADGNGVISVSDGSSTRSISVNGRSQLYAIAQGEAAERDLELNVTSGIRVYALTFG